MSDFWTAILLGLVEGLTEFIPVSSTGHLILFGDAIGFSGERAKAFDVFIQLGAILAVVVLYFRTFLGLLRFGEPETGMSGVLGCFKLFLACLPALVLGALLHKFIKAHLFAPVPVAIALILGGVVLVVIERLTKPKLIGGVDAISPRQALLVGLFQCLALWPGMSRSGSTIVGGMLLGIPRGVAAEFSFLVAVPVMCAAVGFDLLKSAHALQTSDIPLFATGFVVSFLSALLAIRIFIDVLRKYSLAAFGWYRIVLGIVVLWIVA